jgi:hypothetical protein
MKSGLVGFGAFATYFLTNQALVQGMNLNLAETDRRINPRETTRKPDRPVVRHNP